MKRFFKCVSVFGLLFFVACTPAPNTAPSGIGMKPKWIMNPNIDGKRGAVGIAGQTYDQKPSTQRKLAISRALDELSLENGVQVTVSMKKRDNFANGRAFLNMKTEGTYRSKTMLNAHIEDVWEDKMSGQLYVWMVLNK